MSGSLDHSPAQIAAQLLVNLGVGTLPTANLAWPVYDTSQPDTPDNTICIYDTAGVMNARSMVGGEWTEHFGINVRLRTTDHVTGQAKIDSLARSLDTLVLLNAVTLGSSTYVVQSMSRRSGPFDNGPEPESGRRVFTINYLASLRQTN